MSTNATIAIRNENGTATGIYVHWDGYIEGGLGDTLFEHYTTEEKVRQLIEMGDASSIGNTVEESEFYHRDKNEDFEDVCPRNSKTRALFVKEHGQEFNYFFSDGGWEVRGSDGKIIKTESEGETAMNNIIEACIVLGWNVSIPDGKEDDEVKGLVIGTEEYTNKVLTALDKSQETVW